MSLDPQDFMSLLEDNRLDSRMKTPVKTHAQYNLEKTYCTICGHPKGWVSQGDSKYIKAMNIVVICDDCYSQFGSLPLQEAPIKEL
jgi:hypothetical protein